MVLLLRKKGARTRPAFGGEGQARAARLVDGSRGCSPDGSPCPTNDARECARLTVEMADRAHRLERARLNLEGLERYRSLCECSRRAELLLTVTLVGLATAARTPEVLSCQPRGVQNCRQAINRALRWVGCCTE